MSNQSYTQTRFSADDAALVLDGFLALDRAKFAASFRPKRQSS